MKIHRFLILILILSVLLGYGASAFEVRHAQTQYHEERYQFDLVVDLSAPLEYVEQVLRDYEAYPELDGRIIEAEVIDRPQANMTILKTKVRACLGPFCRTVARVEHVEERPGELIARAVPARSDVAFGETHTMLSETGVGTRVIYRTTLTPDFWIPAVVGRAHMLKVLRSASIELFAHVEQRALALQASQQEQSSTRAAQSSSQRDLR